MLERIDSRIKTKKEKRWVAVSSSTCSNVYKDKAKLEEIYSDKNNVQFIEI
jgi:hypothetical protein